jgi:hypothetical protein
MVELVRFFNGERGEAKLVGRARTVGGVAKLANQAPIEPGWGCEVRGSVDALKAIGAKETEIGWVLTLDRYTQEMIGCSVSS